MNRKKQLLTCILTFVLVFSSMPAMGLFAETYDFEGSEENWRVGKGTTELRGDTPLEVGDIIGNTVSTGDNRALKIYYRQSNYDYEVLKKVDSVINDKTHKVLDANEVGLTIPDGMKFKNWQINSVNMSGDYTSSITLLPNFSPYEVIYDLNHIEVIGDKPSYVTTSQAITLTLQAHSGYTLPATVTVEVDGNPSPITYTQGTGVLSVTNITGDTKIKAAGVPIQSPPIDPPPGGSDGGNTGGGNTWSSYTLTFETNDGSTIPKLSRVSDTTIYLKDYISTREGYDFSGWHLDKELTEEITSIKLRRDTTIYAKWIEKVEEVQEKEKEIQNPFTDVSNRDYYYDAVLWAIENGITTGTSGTTFSPEMISTRAQAVAFLWRTMGSPETDFTDCPFTDVSKDAYYYKAVLWAIEKGITEGTSTTTFSPNDTVTRCQSMTFLWRMDGKSKVVTLNPFTDVPKDAYYYDAVLWAVDQDITQGTSPTTFSPVDPCIRGQFVTFLYRYMN